MRKVLLAAVGSAALGLFAAGTASATPLSTGGRAVIGTEATAPITQDVAWRTVCKKRVVWRRDRFGRPIRVAVRDCDRVWVGHRYPPRYHGGYYAEPYHHPRPYY